MKKNVFPKININKLLENVVEDYKIEYLVIFGSYLNKDFWQGSDLDIGYLSKVRLSRFQMEDLILLLMAITKYENINLIDMHFDGIFNPDKLIEKSEGIIEMRLIEYEIIKNGKLIYEREKGSFDKVKKLADIQKTFTEDNCFQLIIENKLNAIKEQFQWLSNVYNLANKSKFGESNILNKIVDAANIKYVNSIIKAAVKLNFHILSYYNIEHTKNSFDSFIYLSELNIFDAKSIHLKHIGRFVRFKNLLPSDYHGADTEWVAITSIGKFINMFKNYYIDTIEDFLVKLSFDAKLTK